MTTMENPVSVTNAKILLASGSPRRRELLRLIVPEFDIARTRNVEESYPSGLPALEVAPFLSGLKAEAYSHDLVTGEIIITADTVVILDGRILGKPCDENQAVKMLRSLSGRTHHVVTGVTITSLRGSETFSEVTEVTFAHLSDREIELYVNNFHPMDKAGAYGIQEWIGCIGITSIKGCYYNVMGLPLHTLYRHLKDFKY